VEEELGRLRTVSTLGIISSLIILSALGRFTYFLFSFSRQIRRGIFLLDLVFILLAVACLFYSLYALMGQGSFFRRWGRRFEQLHTLENELLKEKGKD